MLVFLRELVAVVERHVDRRHVRLQEHVGDDRLLLQLGALALVARVLVRAEVVPGPAVETALLDMRDVVGHEVVAQGVALVHRRPELAGLRMGGQPDGVADAVGEDCARSCRRGRTPGSLARRFSRSSSSTLEREPTET